MGTQGGEVGAEVSDLRGSEGAPRSLRLPETGEFREEHPG